jgi:DNA-binding MarR family transcriptional regulator
MAAKIRTKASKVPGTSAPPRAFGGGLDELIGYNLRRAHGIQKQRFDAAFGRLGIRPVTLSALGTIYEHPDIKQADLGRRLHIKRANMVPLLAELVARGLVSRRPSESDRRAQLVKLTPAGRKLTAQLLERHDRLEADLMRSLGAKESKQLLELLKKFRRLSPKPEVDEIDAG